MSYINRPPPVNGNINTWGERLNDWLVRNRSKLAYYLAGQPATEDGILLWDAVNSKILVSSNGSWVDVGSGGGGSITNYLRDDADDSTSFRLTMGGLTVDTNTLYVDSAENEVGIGTTNPSEKLEVVGNVEATEFIGDLRGAVVFKAKAGEALAIGDVVYISGISGNTTVVNKADADDAAKMPAFGLAANSVSNNAAIEIYTFGTLSGLDTSSFTEGDELFVGTTAGAFVSVAPAGESSLIQKIGKVTRAHGSAGSIKIIGAGRTNATPNLNSGNFFLGDSNHQATTTSFATAVSAAETNNLTAAVTWANVPDANITESSVTQHQAALSITESQINDLGAYLTAHQDISGKANLSGATFTGDVSFNDGVKAKFGTDNDLLIYHNNGEPSVIEDAGELGLVLKTNGNFFAVISDTNENMITATPDEGVTLHYDGTAKVTVGTSTVTIGDDLSVQSGSDLYVLGGDLDVTGDIIVSGTVDGVNVGNLKYHNVDYFMLRDGYIQNLSTSMIDIGTYTDIFDTATPMPTMRLLDLNASINWLDTIYNGNTYQNDVEIRLQLVVPTGTTNAVSLGSVTQISGGQYTVANSFQKWYYVSGDVTHHLSDFGKMHENSSGGSNERTLYGYQYHPTLDRTYFNISTYPTPYATGTTVYWHPYQWESAGAVLTDYRYAREKGRSGSENVSLMYKTTYDDRNITYRIKIRELSSSSTQPDRAQIGQTMLQITKQEP